MAYTKYRHFNRSSAHRQAMLRNLVTSLIKHESISTTWHKAKEAQRLAEKCITLAKKNTAVTRMKAEAILYSPHENGPKLFKTLVERYRERPGGYTRVLRIPPLKDDQAESAILELVDGPKDMRFAMTAKTVARANKEGNELNQITVRNIKKVTKFRKDGEAELQKLVDTFK
ncbi:ribosomal protein L17, partial [Ascodesmis nigricans]